MPLQPFAGKAEGSEVLFDATAVLVGPQHGQQHDLGPGAARCHRLIGPLATKRLVELSPQNRLADGGQAIHRHREVQICGTEDDHVRHALQSLGPHHQQGYCSDSFVSLHCLSERYSA